MWEFSEIDKMISDQGLEYLNIKQCHIREKIKRTSIKTARKLETVKGVETMIGDDETTSVQILWVMIPTFAVFCSVPRSMHKF